METNLIVYPISKEEIVNCDLTEVLGTLHILSKNGSAYYNSLVITFSGYDDVADEIYEIMEIRKFVRELFNKCPHILYFTNQQFETHQHLLCCLCDYETMQTGPKRSPMEWARLGFTQDKLPKHNIHLRLSEVDNKRIRRSTIQFANKVGDRKGGNQIIEMLNSVFL